jgi:hypothetical protein
MSRQDVGQMADVPGWTIAGLEHSRGMSWGICVERNATQNVADSSSRLPCAA